MTFFLRPLMSKLSRFWKERPEIFIPLLFFAVMGIHGSLIWLTDDEAYYWVLAQKPSLGYAYHPPAVAWLIALSESIFGVFFKTTSPALVRLPGIACMALTLWLGMGWIKKVNGLEQRMGLAQSGAILLSFAGIFSLSWMMVPDLPLFFGWTLAFISVWEICFSENLKWTSFLGTAAGITLAFLSKYSAVLAVGSAGLCVLLWAPSKRRFKAVGAILMGACLGVLPSLIWNANHEWSSILWQIRDRHEGGAGLSLASISWVRYLRYWAVEILAAGPLLVPFTLWIMGSGLKQLHKRVASPVAYAALWALPGAMVFCLQPLIADFKPHWSFIVWWPGALLMAARWGVAKTQISGWLGRLGRVQLIYGWVLGAWVLMSCHFPVNSWIGQRNPSFDPRWDVTNDLYGWRDLGGFLQSMELASQQGSRLSLPVIGSRYQTASQAAFVLQGLTKVTLIPADLKSKDEWPDLKISEGKVGQWPRLKSTALFVTDNRYDAPPEFIDTSCKKIGKLQKARLGLPAKWIEVWRCEPGLGRVGP